MSDRTLKRFGITLALLGAAMVLISAPELVRRLRSRSESLEQVRWSARKITSDTFDFREQPVRLETVSRDAQSFVDIHWAGEIASLPVTGRDNAALPSLTRHDDWLGVFELLAVRGNETVEEALALDNEYKLVVVSRAMAPGYDPKTWGAVRRKEWVYTYIELAPEGFEQSTRQQDDLEQKTWRYIAAMQVTPGAQRPKAQLENDGFEELGWAWDGAAIGFSIFAAGLVLIGASRVTREKTVRSAI